MDERIVRFIAALRGEGVRVSIAESEDAMQAVGLVDAANRLGFETALRTTLIKEHHDEAAFSRLFPLFFHAGAPPMLPAASRLSAEELKQLHDALQALGLLGQDWLQRLLDGETPQVSQMRNSLERAGLAGARARRDLTWLVRQTMRELGMARLEQLVQALIAQLAQAGLPAELFQDVQALLNANAAALQEHVSHFVGAALAERLSEMRRGEPHEVDLLDTPFRELFVHQAPDLRKAVERLAAKLRTRAALRQARGKGRTFDAKATLRANVRYGGIPFEILRKTRRKKPKITVLCDISTSMRTVVYFLLLLLHQIQTQVGRTRSFAYIDRMVEISDDFSEHRPEVAVSQLLKRMPAGHYNTDFGSSLVQFYREYLDSVDRRTTVIICGDGRNNFSASRADLLQDLARRSRSTFWFNPEPQTHWGSGDSDMHEYVPVVHGVFQVSNLRQLSEAIDSLLG